MIVTLFVGLVVAIPLLVSLGERAFRRAATWRRPLAAPVGTASLCLGVVTAALFFSSAVQALEPWQEKASDSETKAGIETAGIELETTSETEKAGSNLPVWVEQQPQREGDRHSTPVASDFFDSQPGALRDLDGKIQQAADRYVDWWLDREGASRHIHYPVNQIKQRWLVTKEPILEHRRFAWGEMYRSHALLEFTPEFRKQVQHDWDEFVARSRVWQMGLAGGGVLLLLLTFFGYFRMDNATRGFYTGRLRFLVALALLALIGAGLYFARLIPWV